MLVGDVAVGQVSADERQLTVAALRLPLKRIPGVIATTVVMIVQRLRALATK